MLKRISKKKNVPKHFKFIPIFSLLIICLFLFRNLTFMISLFPSFGSIPLLSKTVFENKISIKIKVSIKIKMTVKIKVEIKINITIKVTIKIKATIKIAITIKII